MSRKFIDRDALIASIPKTNVDIFENCRNCSTLCDWQVRELIEQAELVDAVEVVHGEWKKGIHQAECSACCEKFYFGDDIWLEDYDICEDIGWKYCPNCGAKMDGEVKE